MAIYNVSAEVTISWVVGIDVEVEDNINQEKLIELAKEKICDVRLDPENVLKVRADEIFDLEIKNEKGNLIYIEKGML